MPTTTELIKLSQCGGNEQDLTNMERCIVDKLDRRYDGVTTFTFFKLFYRLIVDQREDEKLFNTLVSTLEVVMCRHDFMKYRVGQSSCGYDVCFISSACMLLYVYLVTMTFYGYHVLFIPLARWRLWRWR